MNKMNYEENLNQRAELFKALGHPARLLILNLVKVKPRHGEELAAILGLTPATVSHHLSKLANVGLLTSEKEQYYQMYSPAGDMMENTLGEIVRLPQPGLTGNVAEDAYRTKVLKTFFKHGRLSQIPAQQKKRLVVLEYLVQEFEPGRQYPEREVNHILLDFNEDVATLRREMIDHRLMKREKGIYERIV
jgi:ArsR family transcriptional regulator